MILAAIVIAVMTSVGTSQRALASNSLPRVSSTWPVELVADASKSARAVVQIKTIFLMNANNELDAKGSAPHDRSGFPAKDWC
jgi:hypothetical protein